MVDSLIGARISSLSKICVVAPSSSSDAEIDYTFYAFNTKDDEVDVSGNCGNMISAIGPYAFEHGMLRRDTPQDGEVMINILAANTNKIIRSTFLVKDGE